MLRSKFALSVIILSVIEMEIESIIILSHVNCVPRGRGGPATPPRVSLGTETLGTPNVKNVVKC